MSLISRARSALAAFKTGTRVAPEDPPRPPSAVQPDWSVPSHSLEPQSRVYNRWTPADIRAAQVQADSGNLQRAADLCDAILGDDRANAVLNTRANAVVGAPVSFDEGRGRRKRAAVKALEVGEDWYSIFDEPVVAQLLVWGRLLGVAPAQKCWREFKDHGNRLLPVVANYHARYLRWDQRDRLWRIEVDGPQRDVICDPAGPKWILFTPYGENRPWAQGLWRGMARWWLLKQYAIDDWGKHSEVHGQPIKVGVPPAVGDAKNATPKLRKELSQDIAALASSGTMVLPPGFDFKLVEATARTWEMFKAQIDMANTAMSVMAIGTNLPTEVQQGVGTGATAATLVIQDYKDSDNNGLGTMAHDHVLTWWADWNFGDRGLAAWPWWDVEPEQDKKARADLIGSVVGTLGTAREKGIPLNEEELLSEFDVPVRPTEDDGSRQGQVYKYHLDYGALTKNEIRKRLGYEAQAGGDVAPEPLYQPGGQEQLSALSDYDALFSAYVHAGSPGSDVMAALAAKAERYGTRVETLCAVYRRGANQRSGIDAQAHGLGRVRGFLAGEVDQDLKS